MGTSFKMSQLLRNKIRHQVRVRRIGPSLLLPIVVWSVLLLPLDHVQSKAIKTFAGPYIAFGHTFDVCPSENLHVLNIRASHFNPFRPFELQVLVGNATFREDMMDNFWSQVHMAVRSNNQWKENAFVFNFPNVGCSAIRDHVPDLYRMLAKQSGASMDKTVPCRLPAGVWPFKNEPVNWSFPNFPIMPYGRYKFRVSARSNSNKDLRSLSACLEVDCEVIPRPS
ncbi:uncharacterized protein LOC117639920 isoform X2 [Thrips palmi]|nr:uncharacterized protein LOC117639920 isoform X2 [Thrips palmi]XP_034231876.1 uncharacterized protein LOC117639920 isoform X2 [Thrips palmi]XP_034231877.1 uncharacterized protein LOC117639920 isoform X2 [Thrips palmi]XP_034231878.1 uncharacterized protein LOC117639920 isoform X2 [Thrips palmi]